MSNVNGHGGRCTKRIDYQSEDLIIDIGLSEAKNAAVLKLDRVCSEATRDETSNGLCSWDGVRLCFC